MQLREGDRINHYTLLEPLGEGGQGAVWKVVDPRDGGTVRALKLISLAETGPAAFDRARREARILAAARHPALVTCHSLFEEPRDGIVGLVMDLVSGSSLADAVEARRLDGLHGVAVLTQVAEALAYVHRAGLVHRDLKPENLLLTEGFWEDPHRAGAVKLVDFGIAAPTSEADKLTTPGTVIGTVPYLAPELVDPATWGKGTGQARDVFAFGVLGCLLLLEAHPTGLGFGASMIDFARAYKAAQVGRIAWPPPGLRGSWGTVVGACLALRPGDRPVDGAAVLKMLDGGSPASTTPHRSPSGASVVTTDPMAVPTSSAIGAITAPMPVPPPGAVRTVEAAPVLAAVSHPRPPSRRWVGAVLLVGAGAVAGAAVFAALGRPSTDSSTSTPWADATSPHTVAPSPPGPQDEMTLSPCYDPNRPFSGRGTHFRCLPCERDAGHIPSQLWQMRLNAVSPPAPGEELLCTQVTGHPTVCTHLSDPDAAARLPVTTADLIGGHVYFSVRDASKAILHDASGARLAGFGHLRDRATTIKETALCVGLILEIEGTSTLVTVYLDDH